MEVLRIPSRYGLFVGTAILIYLEPGLDDPCFKRSLGLLLKGSNPKIEDIHRFQVYILEIYPGGSGSCFVGFGRSNHLKTIRQAPSGSDLSAMAGAGFRL